MSREKDPITALKIDDHGDSDLFRDGENESDCEYGGVNEDSESSS